MVSDALLTGDVRSQGYPMGYYKFASRGYWLWRGIFPPYILRKIGNQGFTTMLLLWNTCAEWHTSVWLYVEKYLNLDHYWNLFSMCRSVGYIEYPLHDVLVKFEHILSILWPWLQVYYAKEVLADLEKSLKDLRLSLLNFSSGSVSFSSRLCPLCCIWRTTFESTRTMPAFPCSDFWMFLTFLVRFAGV